MNTSIKPIESQYETGDNASSALGRVFPTAAFYRRVLFQVFKAAFHCKYGSYNKEDWCESCCQVLKAVEKVGGSVSIQGLENLKLPGLPDGPCVIAGNHMSTLETFILPFLVEPSRPVTFIVKEQLIRYPVFKHIMLSCDPIAVGRQDPRKDLVMMMKEGQDRLDKGVSIVVFPQPTRSHVFNKSNFNSIALKIAARAKVPLVPMAVKTDFWQNGRWMKDFGPVDVQKKVHFAFGKAMQIEGKGKQEQEQLMAFVEKHLKEWGCPIET